MTIIAWDGKTIAADRQATCADMKRAVTKLFRSGANVVYGFTGSLGPGLLLMQWHQDGADTSRWPAFQSTDDWSHLIVADLNGVRYYERHPIALWIDEPFFAWGSGRDYALGAMAHGASAAEAVEISNRFCASTGLGVDSFVFDGAAKVETEIAEFRFANFTDQLQKLCDAHEVGIHVKDGALLIVDRNDWLGTNYADGIAKVSVEESRKRRFEVA